MQIAVVERSVHPRHGDLHDVRGGPLDGHVDRHAFGGVAHGVHRTRHVGDVAPPAEQCLDVALLDTEGLRLEDVPADLRVALEVLVDEALGFLAGHLHPPREAEVAHSVDDPEVEHLGDVALLTRDVLLLDAEASGRGAAMDIGTGAERIEQRGILRHVREHTQLDLRVVRGHEHHVRRAGDERVADPASERRADRDVLQVRPAAREPSRSGDGLVEGRVDAPCLRIDQSSEPLGVRRAELFDLAVLEDLLDHRMRAAKLLEHRRVGGKTRPGAATAGQLELVEQERLQLLGRVDAEIVAHGVVGLALDSRDLTRELLPQRAQVREVHGDPRFLHFDEHVDERQLDVAVEPLEAEALELNSELFAKTRRRHRARAGTGHPLVERGCAQRIFAVRHRQDGDLQLQPFGGKILKRVVSAAGVDEVARDHRVHRESGQISAGAP